jgi:hypothetical protein
VRHDLGDVLLQRVESSSANRLVVEVGAERVAPLEFWWRIERSSWFGHQSWQKKREDATFQAGFTHGEAPERRQGAWPREVRSVRPLVG